MCFIFYSVKSDKQVKHFKVVEEGGRFHLNQTQSFCTLMDLVEFYSTNNLGSLLRLGEPCAKVKTHTHTRLERTSYSDSAVRALLVFTIAHFYVCVSVCVYTQIHFLLQFGLINNKTYHQSMTKGDQEGPLSLSVCCTDT